MVTTAPKELASYLVYLFLVFGDFTPLLIVIRQNSWEISELCLPSSFAPHGSHRADDLAGKRIR